MLSFVFPCLLSVVLFQESPLITARVNLSEPQQHFIGVEMVFPKSRLNKRVVQMPVWTPGSYKIRDYARSIEGFQVTDLSGQPLPWTQEDKSSWVIDTGGDKGFKISYRLFANEYSVRTNYLDSFFGVINPAAAFFYEPGLEYLAYHVAVSPPKGWSVATSLPRLSDNVFRADNWHALVDSPLLCGELRVHEFEIRGIPHYWVIAGDVSLNETGVIDALKKVGNLTGNLFGGFPFDRYFFLTQFRLTSDRGGLEHRNSTLIQYPADQLHNRKGWDRFLRLMIHEYFHAWNVKTIQDQSLKTPNYQQEVYSRLLWLHEGFTGYFADLTMARAGFWSAQDMLKQWAQRLDAYQNRPGREVQSLEDASFNAWIHQYQRDENFLNSRVSYYDEGAVAGLALDLYLRHKSKNQVGLDDFMRVLYVQYGQLGKGIDNTVIDDVLRRISGQGAVNFINTHIRGARPFDLNQLLSYAGIDMQTPAKAEPQPFQPAPLVSLGITTQARDGALFVTDVRRGGPAWQAGLDFGDELLAINDRRTLAANYEQLLEYSHPGDEVTVLVSRTNRILRFQVILEARATPMKLALRADAGAIEREIYGLLFDPATPITSQTEEKP